MLIHIVCVDNILYLINIHLKIYKYNSLFKIYIVYNKYLLKSYKNGDQIFF